MSWFFPWSDNIKKRSCRYLLQRYLGQFLEEKLTLDQLSVDQLHKGIGSVSNVSLDVEALNELGKQQNLPIEFVDGFISEITVSIPWKTLLTDSSSVEVSGLNLVIQPKYRSDNSTSMFDSSWSSMTSSIQLAEECLKQSSEQNLDHEQTNFVNGVEEFAKTIDSILTRVKLNFINTVIRLEHLSKESSTGVAIEMHIKQLNYYDESSTEMNDENSTKPTSAYSIKMFSLEGIEFYSNEFYSLNRTISRSLLVSTSSMTNENLNIPNRNKNCNNDEIILFGKLLGKQEVRLKIKQKENIPGPKIDLETNMDSLVIFLSPRQLRTVCEVICGLMSPHLQDTSNVASKSRYNQKPMTSADFERVEQKLNQHINPSNLTSFVSKSLQNATGWSSGGVEDESDEDFHPVKENACSSLSSSTANSVSSSFSSGVSSYHYKNKTHESCNLSTQPTHYHNKYKDKGGAGEPDFSGDNNSFLLRLNFLAVILLHQDTLLSSDSLSLPKISIIEEMKRLSQNFFSLYYSLSTSYGRNDFKAGKLILEKATSERNHFRLFCTTNIMNCDTKSNHSNFEIRGSLTMANAELVECLMELNDKPPETVQLLGFIRHNASTVNESDVTSTPDIRLNFKHFKNSKHFSTPSRIELNINLQDFETEVDVTIIDRLTHLIDNFSTFYYLFVKPSTAVKTVFSDVVNLPTTDSKFEWKISSPFTVVKLRFPVPDLSTEEDGTHEYWQKRDIYNDILFVELTENCIQSLISDNQPAQSFEVQSRSVRVLFQELNNDTPTPFIFSGVDDRFGTSLPNGGRGFGWPRLVLRLYPKTEFIELEEEEEKQEYRSHMTQSIMQTQKQEPSPFTAKMIMRESDTSHSKSTPNNDGEEIILPGSKEEIREFIEDASHNSLLQLDITLPTLIVLIPSKHFYEVIYNRFNTDLMLWMPKISKSFYNSECYKNSRPNFNFNLNPSSTVFTSFSMCKSNIKSSSDSEDEDSNENVHNVENVSQSQKKEAASQQQSKFTVSLFAAQGVLDVFPHARDSCGKVIPGQFGEIQLLFNEANLFCVSGYKADPLLSYVCLQINYVSLNHCSLIPGNAEISLKPIDSYSCEYVLPTFYKTNQGAVVNDSAYPVGIGSATSDDMLTLSIRVQGEENRLKSICIANNLNGVTIRHKMKPSYTSWLSQLVDFFDIMDYPIPNYQPWKVVTQLHQQFLNCVIDYRPLYLPLKAALIVENFNISSNITTKTSTSILRFILEEASLFISNKVNEKSNRPEELSIDLKNDYVCVVDLGLFELSLRLMNNGEDEPHTDLRASSNIVHIRTCADSTVALMELVKYIASDGDLVCEKNEDYKSKIGSADDMLVNLRGESKKNTPFMTTESVATLNEGVPYLVEEAINDTTVIKPNKRKGTYSKRRDDDGRVEMFFFPDEENIPYNVSTFTDSQSSEDDIETEYCVLEQEIGIGYLGKSNIPEVRLLTKEPIKVIDNHFTVPMNKVDVLKAPKSYPSAVSKYTLREITIVWHMYGGHDFDKDMQAEIPATKKKQVTIVEDVPSQDNLLYSLENRRFVRHSSFDNVNINYSASKYSSDSSAVNFMVSRSSPKLSLKECGSSLKSDSPSVLYDKQKSNSWQTRGGVNRQHDTLMELRLTKLKFQYELYPTNTKQASRQVLLVQEVEIRDRMATSNINKFLYLQSTSTRPKQSHANMVVIKATRIRPEPNVSHLQECCLRVSLLPLRLNIDQDSLLFLINFFSDVSCSAKSDDTASNSNTIKPSLQPVMNIENMSTLESSSFMVQVDGKQVSGDSTSTSSPVFIRSFIFAPEVPIRLDYEGKRVDMSHGPLAGLIMGLGQLNCSELKLKRLCNRQGFLGIDKLISYVLTEWLQDIKKNQLPSILGGVGPMYSLVQLFQGIRDLFWLPIEQYQKDGRIVRGLQRGANSFTTSTAMAALELTARIVHAIQRIAETAFDIVSPGPSIRHLRYYDRKNDYRKNRRHHKYSQPADIREGVATALLLVKEGFGETAQTLVRVASIEHEVKGAVGAVGGVLRQIPSTALTPIILASQATSNVLDGVKSQLVPDARAEAALKWRTDYF